MLALSLSDKVCCFGIFVFVFNRFLFFRFSFHHFSVFVLVFVNEFVIFSFFTIFVFVNENHTAAMVLITKTALNCFQRKSKTCRKHHTLYGSDAILHFVKLVAAWP